MTASVAPTLDKVKPGMTSRVPDGAFDGSSKLGFIIGAVAVLVTVASYLLGYDHKQIAHSYALSLIHISEPTRPY